MKCPYVIKALVAFVGMTVLLHAQVPPKKTPAQPKADTWERSKECAAQSERIMADPNLFIKSPDDWRNHYSPKYDKCFVLIHFSSFSKDESAFPSVFRTALYDAFERSELAASCTVLQKRLDCLEQVTQALKTVTLPNPESYCGINDQPIECTKAEAFIYEHMKN
jgi:hypothetical protein